MTSVGIYFRSHSAHNISVAINGDVLIYYPSDYSTITYGDYYSVTSSGQPVLVKNASVSAAISAGITPKAVVFALPSEMDATDKTKWPHAYAMALKEAGVRVAWSTSTSTTVQTSTHRYTSATAAYQDMGGYEATHNITDKNSTNPSTYNSTTYPAFFAALNYDTTPAGSSGWFLPTNGQWNNILVRLGGMSSGLTGAYWSGATAVTAATNLNKYLNFDSTIATRFLRADNSTERMYWCSGESSASAGCVISFDNGGHMYCFYAPSKTVIDWEGGYLYARACIAF